MEREEAEWVVQRHGQTVYRLAYARTGNREDAEDVTQETFLRLVRAAPKFRDEDHCRAWLLRVAANCAQDLFRAPWRKRERPIEEAEHLHVADHIPEPGGVLEAVLSLPESYRLRSTCFTTRGCPFGRSPGCWAREREPCGPASPGPGPCCGTS